MFFRSRKKPANEANSECKLLNQYNTMNSSTDMRYFIADGQLVGSIDGQSFFAEAGSGGRAGSKKKGVLNIGLANNPDATCVRGNDKDPDGFGPIPEGLYYMKTHEKNVNWIRLNQDPTNNMCGRDGFAIHGRGPTGSHGCIVPNDFGVVLRLYAICLEREKNKKAPPTLQVIRSVGSLCGA